MHTTTRETNVSPRPRGRVAPATHPLELQRLALLEEVHASCNPLHAQFVMWLVRANTAITAAYAENLRPLGLSPSGFSVLLALVTTPGQRLEPRQIADRLQLSRPSVTGLLDTLQDRGFVVRRPHRDDRRRVLVEPTQRGLRVFEEHFPRHCEGQARLLHALSDDEIETLVLMLRKVEGATPTEYGEEPPA